MFIATPMLSACALAAAITRCASFKGAIGVSGGMVEQDQQVAEAGAAALSR